MNIEIIVKEDKSFIDLNDVLSEPGIYQQVDGNSEHYYISLSYPDRENNDGNNLLLLEVASEKLLCVSEAMYSALDDASFTRVYNKQVEIKLS